MGLRIKDLPSLIQHRVEKVDQTGPSVTPAHLDARAPWSEIFHVEFINMVGGGGIPFLNCLYVSQLNLDIPLLYREFAVPQNTAKDIGA